VALEPGDLLMIYTDGITEASRVRNDAREFFETERLDRTLIEASLDGARDCVQRLTAVVNAFSGRPVPADDQTLLAIRVSQSPAS
jgi:serine phosphatase RsbU (regulator of sigma subunit)